MEPRIQAALSVVDKTYTGSLTAKALASQLGLSRSRFEHLFRRQTGRPFKSYVRGVRLSKGAGLLVDGRLRVKEIASYLGYSYAQDFNRDFKRLYGVSPPCYKMSARIAKSDTK
jgi:transcriptional regulator GlxA family with amidase domain